MPLDSVKTTKFECMPNEILLELFEYLSPYDIFQSFYFLNKRYNHFLMTLYLRVDLINLWKKDFDYYNYFLFSLVPHRIRSFRCEDVFDRLIYQIHLKDFTSLKYLTIDNLNLENLEFIVPQLNHLQQLIYLNLQTRSNTRSVSKIIFKGQLTSIQKCILNLNNQITFHSHDHSYPNLQDLTINQCTIEDLFSFLHVHTVQLQHLTVTLIEGIILSASDITHHLTSLIMNIHAIPFDRLVKFVFPLFPSLQQLSITAIGTDYTNGKQWSTHLSSHFPHLNKFQLHISFPQDDLPTPNHRLELLKNFQLSYFRSHQWYFAILQRPSITNLELFSLPFIANKFCTNLYQTQIETSFMDRTMFKNIHQLSLFLTNSTEISSSIFFPNVHSLKLLSEFQEYESYPKHLFVDISHLFTFSKLRSIELVGQNFPSTTLVLLDYTPHLHTLIIPLNSLIKMTKLLTDANICDRLTTLIKHLTITSIDNVKNFIFFERLSLVFTHLESLSLFIENPIDLYILMVLILPKMSKIIKLMNITIETIYDYHMIDQFMLWLMDYMHARDLDHVDYKLTDNHQLSFSF